MGGQLPGGNKWSGAVLAADGNIYGIPYFATQVLRLTMTLPEATAELVLELDAQSSKYARLEETVESQPLPRRTSRASKPTEKTLRLDACGCGAYVRLVPQVGYELGMGQIGISVTIERKPTAPAVDPDAAPATAPATVPATAPAPAPAAEPDAAAQPAAAALAVAAAPGLWVLRKSREGGVG